jgi:hypothetical protein
MGYYTDVAIALAFPNGETCDAFLIKLCLNLADEGLDIWVPRLLVRTAVPDGPTYLTFERTAVRWYGEHPDFVVPDRAVTLAQEWNQKDVVPSSGYVALAGEDFDDFEEITWNGPEPLPHGCLLGFATRTVTLLLTLPPDYVRL